MKFIGKLIAAIFGSLYEAAAIKGDKGAAFILLSLVIGSIVAVFGTLAAGLKNAPFITMIVAVGLVYYIIKSVSSAKQEAADKLKDELSKINRENGTQFDMSRGYGDRIRLLFDEDKQKFLYLNLDNYNANRVFDFSYIKGMELDWDYRLENGTKLYFNIMMSLTTSDPMKPLIKIPMNRLEEGEKFLAALKILIG